MSRRDPLRVVVVGTRGHAERVAIPSVAASERAVFVGVVGGDPQRTAEAAARLGVTAFASVEEVVASGAADAAWVTAPNHLHPALATHLLAGGLHVLLEKPMAVDEASATALLTVAESSTTVLRVAFQHRFRPLHSELRRLIAGGSLGPIGYLRVHRYWRFPYFEGQPELSAWRQSPAASGGWSINDIGAHLVDLVLWLSEGRPVTVLDCFFTRRHLPVANDSSAFLTLHLGEAGLGQVDCSNVLGSPGSLVEAYGEDGWARLVNSFHGEASLRSSAGVEVTSVVSDQQTYREMFEDFVGSCHGEPSHGATAAEAALNVDIIQAARRKARFLEDLAQRPPTRPV